MKERKVVTKEIAQGYQKAKKKEKGKILDKFTALTGYNRAYTYCILSNHSRTVNANKGVIIKVVARIKIKIHRESPYEKAKKPLIKIWQVLGYPCGKRLKPILSEAVAKLKGFGKLERLVKNVVSHGRT